MPHRLPGNLVYGGVDPLPPAARLMAANMAGDDRDLKRGHDFADDIDGGELHLGQFHASDRINGKTPRSWAIFDVGDLAAEDGERNDAITLHHHDGTL